MEEARRAILRAKCFCFHEKCTDGFMALSLTQHYVEAAKRQKNSTGSTTEKKVFSVDGKNGVDEEDDDDDDDRSSPLEELPTIVGISYGPGYGDKVEIIDACRGQDVVMLDTAKYAPDIHAVARSLFIIDHHDGENAQHVKNFGGVFDANQCGAELVWRIFNSAPSATSTDDDDDDDVVSAGTALKTAAMPFGLRAISAGDRNAWSRTSVNSVSPVDCSVSTGSGGGDDRDAIIDDVENRRCFYAGMMSVPFKHELYIAALFDPPTTRRILQDGKETRRINLSRACDALLAGHLVVGTGGVVKNKTSNDRDDDGDDCETVAGGPNKVWAINLPATDGFKIMAPATEILFGDEEDIVSTIHRHYPTLVPSVTEIRQSLVPSSVSAIAMLSLAAVCPTSASPISHTFRVSFRSREDSGGLALKLAKRWPGGGGHPNATSANVPISQEGWFR